VLLLVVVAGCGSTGPSGVDPLSVQRPGYPVNGPAMGDPAALVSEPGSPDPVRYRGSAVVQACDLLTPEDLTAAGLLVVPGTATGLVSRTYFDGHGSTEKRATRSVPLDLSSRRVAVVSGACTQRNNAAAAGTPGPPDPG
jgi:hypothetical protein